MSRLTSVADAYDEVVWFYHFRKRRCANIWRAVVSDLRVSDDADVVIEALKAPGILRGGFSRITHQGLARNDRANMGGGVVTATGGQPMIAPNQSFPG